MASLATLTLRIIVLGPPLCCAAVLLETRSFPGIEPITSQSLQVVLSNYIFVMITTASEKDSS